MSQATDHLKNCASVSDVKREIRSLCARFGSIMRIDVLLALRDGTRQAMCFWRMESRQLEDDERIWRWAFWRRSGSDCRSGTDSRTSICSIAIFAITGSFQRKNLR